jgi:hypothetical protein
VALLKLDKDFLAGRSLHSFMNQRNVIFVAKLVQQLHKLMDSPKGALVGTAARLFHRKLFHLFNL